MSSLVSIIGLVPSGSNVAVNEKLDPSRLYWEHTPFVLLRNGKLHERSSSGFFVELRNDMIFLRRDRDT